MVDKLDFQLAMLENFDRKLLQDLITSYELNARNPKTKGTGTSLLMKSLEGKVLSETRYRLFFENYGRFLDMGDVGIEHPPIIELNADKGFRKGQSKHGFKTWVDINFNSFKYVPGYKKDPKLVPRNIAIDRIAWGVAKAMSKSLIKSKQPRRWYSDVLWKAIADLKQALLDGYFDHVKGIMLKP